MIIYLDPLLDLHHVLQDEWWYSHLIAQHPQTELFQSGWPMRASWSYFLYTNSLDDCLFNATASGLLGFTAISIPPFKLINIAASLSLSKEGVGPLFSICSNEKTLIQIFKVMLNISNTLVLSQVSSLKQKFILFFRKVFNSPAGTSRKKVSWQEIFMVHFETHNQHCYIIFEVWNHNKSAIIWLTSGPFLATAWQKFLASAIFVFYWSNLKP